MFSVSSILVESEDCDKTAFICPGGTYNFWTMPFGLCNAGATFQRLMDVVMSGLQFQVCLVYLLFRRYYRFLRDDESEYETANKNIEAIAFGGTEVSKIRFLSRTRSV